MASSSKFDTSSCSPDRPSFPGGQRGGPQLDRSGSFSEVMESQMVNSIPNIARSTSSASPNDIINFFQCLRFDPKVVVADHKSNRQVDFERHIEVALGISVEDSSFSKGKSTSCIPEEIKRVKVGLRESTVKARERVKIFNEALSVYNKFFHSVPSKKRSRLDGGSLMPNDRSFVGSGGKGGNQNLSFSSNSDLEQQKSGDRTRNAATNKRTRTSLVETKINSQNKLSTISDRDRDIQRPVNNASGDDRTSIGVDNWEKTKLKKKRTGTKLDNASTSPLSKPVENSREIKLGIPPRTSNDSRSRFVSESHIFRGGVANGAVGVVKTESGTQPMGLSARLSISRTNADNISLANERKERPVGSEKDRFNLKAANKANACDDFNSSSPISNSKMNSVRGPRSSAPVTPKQSPTVQRMSASNDWELSHCANKPPALATNHRKRSASGRSPSPPVVHWAGQRPQKMSRTARRTNLIPIMHSNDDNGGIETVSDTSGNDVALGMARRLASITSQQVKLKGEPSSNALSDSEESGAPESKTAGKERQSEDVDEKGVLNVQKIPNLSVPSRKNKVAGGAEMADGTKKGRNGRIFTSTRPIAPVGDETFAACGTAKQLKSGKLGFEKMESKIGRPPTRKISDRKCPRQKHGLVNATAEIGNEELMLAANSVICSDSIASTFWREMERFFGLLYDNEIDFLKQQGHLELSSSLSTEASESQINKSANGYVEVAELHSTIGSPDIQKTLNAATIVPLFQRLIAAIIPENDYVLECGEMHVDGCEMGAELDDVELNITRRMDNFQLPGSNNIGKKQPEKCFSEQELSTLEFPIYPINGFSSDHLPYSDFVHGDLQTNEKLKLEVQSIGILLDDMAADEAVDGGIYEEIKGLEYTIHKQVSKRKGLMKNLLNAASKAKENQQKVFEKRALDKLVTMAYGKYTACRGSNSSGGKNSANKLAKQAAALFVKRTLDQCHKYEETGQCCFSEPAYMEMLLAKTSRRPTPALDSSSVDAKSSKLFIPRTSEIKSSAIPSPCSSRVNLSGENSMVVNSPDNSEMNLFPHETDKNYVWSHKMRKKELLLDDVGGPLSSNAKGKRSERERDAKGQSISRVGTTKTGRNAVSNAKGERKTKTKPKQKTGQLSVSVNGMVGNSSEQKQVAVSLEATSEVKSENVAKDREGLGLDVLNDPDGLVFSNLLGVDDGQGHDLGAWLNIDDDGLQEHDDFMGLEIPMDDLSDLNMMV